MKARTQSPPHRGLDIQLFGAIFLIVGAVDLMIIELFPEYVLKLFGVSITGPSAYFVKLHSPVVHLLIGYGFLFLRPWAWGLSLAYAGFGIMSELMNQLAFGYHIVRTGFVVTTMLFILYLVWRRALFGEGRSRPISSLSTSEEEHK